MCPPSYHHNDFVATHTPCLACCALFGSLVPSMCNRASCAQVHKLQQKIMKKQKWEESGLVDRCHFINTLYVNFLLLCWKTIKLFLLKTQICVIKKKKKKKKRKEKKRNRLLTAYKNDYFYLNDNQNISSACNFTVITMRVIS